MSIFDAFSGRIEQYDIEAATDVGDTVFGGHRVAEGTRGRVVDSHSGLLHDSVTVEFETGYTEIVKPSEIQRKRWY